MTHSTLDLAKNSAVVVGSGLVGSLWAIFLAKRGYDVHLFERRGDMRKAGYIGGRSINLAMSVRGWKAIEATGIQETIQKVALPMSGRMMHSVDGKLTYQAYGKSDEAIYSVSRGLLNLELLKLAGAFPNVTMYFDHRCSHINEAGNEIVFDIGTTGDTLTVNSEVIFAADGAFSAVRQSIQKTPRFNYQQEYLEHGYKELTILPNADGTHQLDVNALHIWPRNSFMMIALPNVDGSFTCTMFHPMDGPEGLDHLNTDQQILDFFHKYYPDILPLMPNLVEDFKKNPSSTLVTVRCSPWNYKNKVLLIGDAAHAIVPFYGQGMNAGFEDCTILNEMIDLYDGDWAKIFSEFNATRIQDGNAIATLALRNFVEMRDLVADPMFLLRKKIAADLHQKYPEQFLPVYSMISFSNTPYSIALSEEDAQNELFKQILAIPDIANQWNGAAVTEVFENWYAARII